MYEAFSLVTVLAAVLVFIAVLLCFCVWKIRSLAKRLRQAEIGHSHVQALVDSIPDLTWVKDKDSRFLMVNKQFSNVFGLSVEDVLGKTDEDLSSSDAARQYMEDDRQVIETQQVLRREELIASPEGETWAETVKVPVFDNQGGIIGTAGLARDISERKKAEQHIQHLAHHDALTELPNRTLLEQLVKQNIQKHDPRRDQLTIMFIDLDNFKVINDTISHRIGDKVLVELARRIQSCVRENDIVARIGGDEFIVVFPYTSASQCEKLLNCIKHALAEPIRVESLSFDITMSIGLACYPQDGADCWSLVQNADLAMYHAKQTGKNQSVFFTQHLADRSIHNMTRDSRIMEALEKEEFSLFYQPKVHAVTGKIVGFEALLRWRDRLGGDWILPDDFIPAAERSGFIIKLGDWLIQQVIKQIAAWYEKGIEIPVAINISAVQIHQNRIGQTLKQSLQKYNLPGYLLELELTESVLMENSDKIITRLEEIRDLGVAISIDDFGTGYSNLAYLSRFPLTSLKIDRVFVENIHTHENHFQVASAIMEMAKSMDLKVVAEGVETTEELRVLLDMGVDQLQGFLFDKALPARALCERLSQSFSYADRFPRKLRPVLM